MGRVSFHWGLIWVCIAMMCLPSAGFADKKPLKTAEQVDLDLYMGKWYEIAAIPSPFQKKCVVDTTAEYMLLSNSQVQVQNLCVTEKGKPIHAEGRAKVVDPKDKAKLKVTFVDFFGWRFLLSGDYWITEVAPDYTYALVGHPARKYGWILAREPMISKRTMEDLAERLYEQGYDVCEFMTTPQSKGIHVQQSLCDVVPDVSSSKYRKQKRIAWPG